jgi:transglutaminase-like putative cysteine protease
VRATAVAGFSDVVSLGQFGATIQPNPQVVLRVEFPDVRPTEMGSLHWRGRSYDHFDGVSWSRSERIRPSGGASSWYQTRWPSPRVTQNIYGTLMESRVLFGLHPMIDVDPETPIHPLVDNVGDFFFWGSSTPVYTARSLLGGPAAEELRLASGNFVPDQRFYLQLPPLPERVRTLADSLTRGRETRYDQVARIEGWLRSEFSYTLELPRTADEATLDHFLFERRAGHCEYFSTAMVVLLRSLGIEARNVNGFLGGTWSELGSYLAVTQNDAHSWVEVWFPSFGWVTFDPTPAGSGGMRAATSWFWPGRFFLDAVQHRWGKWVLDYSLRDQSHVLAQALSSLERDGARADGGAAGRAVRLAVLLLVVLLATALTLWARRSRAVPYETRVYLDLVESCRQSGLVRGQVAPLELIERLRERAGTAAAAPAGSLIGLYLRARFAGESLGDEDRVEMGRALQGVRRALARLAAGGAAPA